MAKIIDIKPQFGIIFKNILPSRNWHSLAHWRTNLAHRAQLLVEVEVIGRIFV